MILTQMKNLFLATLKRKDFIIDLQENSSVTLFLKDRPEVAEVLNGHDYLKRWLKEQFSGKVTNFPIIWDSAEPDDESLAEHCGLRKDSPAKVRVSRKLNGLDQLAGVIFELFNIQNHKKHNHLWKKACNGTISKKEYNFRIYHLEYKAMKRCRRFLKDHSYLFMNLDDSNVVCKSIIELGRFEEFFAGIQSLGESYYEKIYEKRIAPYLLEKKKRDQLQKRYKAIKFVESLITLVAVMAGFSLCDWIFKNTDGNDGLTKFFTRIYVTYLMIVVAIYVNAHWKTYISKPNKQGTIPTETNSCE